MDLDFFHVGSFKRGGIVEADDPREAFWNEIERIGTSEYVTSLPPPAIAASNWQRHCDYAQVRLAQAMEFRRSAAVATLLTRSIPLYYAFLNTLRAFLALFPAILPKPKHGLVYISGASLFECTAGLSGGTFQDFLESLHLTPQAPFRISLRDCLGRIVEISRSVSSMKSVGTYVVPVQVHARRSGNLSLDFEDAFVNPIHFQTNWQHEFPSLATECTLTPNTCTLVVKQPLPNGDYGEVCAFCEKHLWPGLHAIKERSWFVMRSVDPKLTLPRDVHYYVAMFILSNIARYEPEQLAEAARFGSETGWLLRRFFAVADRYYPQLMLARVAKMNLYSSVG